MPTLEITPETNIRELVAELPIAQAVLEAFGLGCGGCGVAKNESIAQGATAHGLRPEPIVAALVQARHSGRVPAIVNGDKQRTQRAPGEFARRARFGTVVPIMSGKGGVGKSLVTGLIAVGLRRMGKRVGILDADITGPSIPRLFGLREPLLLAADPAAPPGAKPLMVPAHSGTAIEVVSSNLLTDKEDTAMVWRGPILAGVIRQFYEQALWGDLDYLLVDLPPGTSDAPLTVLQSLPVDGVVLVTMPQALATMIVRKVENMSYFTAPDTGERYDIFGPSYAQQVAELAGAPLLARIPLNPHWLELTDHGRIEEIADPICEALAHSLIAVVKPQQSISIV
jgi:hybrid cluster-associated redox disulfide protein